MRGRHMYPVCEERPGLRFRIMLNDGRIAQNREPKVLADAVGRLIRLHLAGVDRQTGRKFWKSICTLLAKLPKDVDRVEFEKPGAGGILDSFLEDLDGAIQSYETDLAARTFHSCNRVFNKSGIDGSLQGQR